jgi:murein DD-endopeptidase MepM/ murein hydrolase activator NlpD
MAVITLQKTISYAKAAGFTGNALATICEIALAESGLDTSIVNSIGATGILQILLSAHPDVTSSQAKDPAFAFRYAYALSGGGNNFCPWQSYDSGICGIQWDNRYKQYIAQVQGALSTGGGTSKTATTINASQIPNKTGVAPWWTFARIDNMGVPDPFGGFPKPDSNIQLPANYPIIALLPGTITFIDGGEVGWGGVITLKLDHPPNAIATHNQYEHLAGTTVRVGQHVNAGDLIAYNGGAAAQGAQKVPLGFGYYHGDHYGSGDGWQYETSSNLNGGPLDPVPLLNAARAGTLQVINSGSSSSSSFGGSGGQFLTTVLGTAAQANQIVNTIPGFLGICEGLDMVEQFVPFALPTTSAINQGSQDINIFGWDTGILTPGAAVQQAVQLPSDAIQAVLVFTVTNFMAFAIRAIFVIVGVVLAWSLLINLISENIDVSQLGALAGQAAELAA